MTVMTASRAASATLSKRSSSRNSMWPPPGLGRRAGGARPDRRAPPSDRSRTVGGQGRGDQVGTDVRGEALPHRLHRGPPQRHLVGGQRQDLGLAGGLDLGAGLVVQLVRNAVGVGGGLCHRLRQFAADVLGQLVPPGGVGHHHVVDHAVVGLGDRRLHLVELLREDVRPGVLLAIHHAGLQRLVDFGELHLLRVGAERGELRLQHVGGLDAELQAGGVGRYAQLLVGRHLLHAVVPVGQAEQVHIGHRGQQGLAGRALLEAVDGGQIVEHEGQVEDLQRLGEAVELGERRRDQLHVAQQQGLQFLVVAEQRRARIDLDHHLAGQPAFHQLLELERALALGRGLGHHVTELDDDGFGAGGAPQHKGYGRRGGCEKLPHEHVLPDVSYVDCLPFDAAPVRRAWDLVCRQAYPSSVLPSARVRKP
eukprot:Opistho-2@27407